MYCCKAGWQCHVSFWKKKLSEFSSLQFNLLSIIVICKCICLNPPSKTISTFARMFLCHSGKSVQVPTALLFWQRFGWSSGNCTVNSKGNLNVWTHMYLQKERKPGITQIWQSSSHYLLLISSNLCVAAPFLSSHEVKLISSGECAGIWDQKASRDFIGRAAGMKRLMVCV